MLDKEMDMISIYASMQKAIDDEIKKNSKYVDKRQEKMDDSTKKMGFFDRLSNKGALKEYNQKITQLNELKQSLFNFHFKESDKYSFPVEVIEQFENLGSNLTQDEFAKLKESVNNCLKDVNRERKNAITEASVSTLKILEKLGFTGRSFLVYRNPENKMQYIDSVSYKRALELLQQEAIKELTPDHVSLHAQQSSVDLAYGDKALSQDIDKLVQSGNYEATPSVTAIVKNYSEIKNKLISKDRCETVLSQISALKNMLVGITEVNVEGLTGYVNQLETSYKKELEKANKYLEKFDFTDIKRQIEEQKEKERQEKNSSINLGAYERLAYELEQVKTETPEDYQKIHELEAEMEKLAKSSELTSSQLDQAKINSVAKYQNEARGKQAQAKAQQTKLENDKRYQEVEQMLREEAIRQLENSGAFLDLNVDRESLITSKIGELKRFASQTPEERLLFDLKSHGQIGSTATVNDLTPTQINDARIAYTDHAFDFVKPYKDLITQEAQAKANTIYKEYMRYRATLSPEDKVQGNYESFAEFAQRNYQLNATLEMVDYNLKEELEEQARRM